MSRLRILSWNLAGGKILCEEESLRRRYRQQLTTVLQDYCSGELAPDVLLFQEAVRFQDTSGVVDLIEPPPGYRYRYARAIDTIAHGHPSKWARIRQAGLWPDGAYLSQGLAVLWREELVRAALWEPDPVPVSAEAPITVVPLEAGLYTGTRDTEPRPAALLRLVVDVAGRPVDVMVVNLHLTTLAGERQGQPDRDEAGSRIRMKQLDTVLHRIVSPYNRWRSAPDGGRRSEPAVWVLAGDFNATPAAPEIERLRRLHFVDLNPTRGSGSKATTLWARQGTLTVDYIFAGPIHIALEAEAVETVRQRNPPPSTDVVLSDHFPILAELPLVGPAVGPRG